MTAELISRLRSELADLESRIAATADPDEQARMTEQAVEVELSLSAWEIDANGQ